MDPNGIYKCRQLLLLRRFYISDGHPLRNSTLQYTSCKTKSEVMTIFPSGLRAHQKKVKISRCPKVEHFKRATDSQVGGVYFMVLNSQPFWLVLRSQKCVLENFGSNLEGSELSGKRLFCGQTRCFSLPNFLLNSSESLNISRMNQ